jgi:hypothetical protein
MDDDKVLALLVIVCSVVTALHDFSKEGECVCACVYPFSKAKKIWNDGLKHLKFCVMVFYAFNIFQGPPPPAFGVICECVLYLQKYFKEQEGI